MKKENQRTYPNVSKKHISKDCQYSPILNNKRKQQNYKIKERVWTMKKQYEQAHTCLHLHVGTQKKDYLFQWRIRVHELFHLQEAGNWDLNKKDKYALLNQRTKKNIGTYIFASLEN